MEAFSLASGQLCARIVNFSLEDEETRAIVMSQTAKQELYFVLVHTAEGVISMRLFQGLVKDDTTALAAKATDILAFPEGDKLVSMINFTSTVTIFPYPSELYLVTQERTIHLSSVSSETKNVLETLVDLVHNKNRTRGPPKPQMQRRSWLNSISTKLTKTISSSVKPRQLRTSISIENKELKSLDQILDSEQYRGEFRKYLKFAYAEENLEFYEQVGEFEKASHNGSKEGVNELFNRIQETFVLEGAPKEVNLPSYQRQALRDIYNQLSREGVLVTEVPNHSKLFLDAKREIFNLLERNFSDAFVKSLNDQASRLRQIEETRGCFTTIWRQEGAAGYHELLRRAESNLAQLVETIKFLHAIVAFYANQMEELSSFQRGFPFYQRVFDQKTAMPQNSLDQVLYRFVKSEQRRERVQRELLGEIYTVVIYPLEQLHQTLSSGIRGVREKADETVAEVVAMEQKVVRAAQSEVKLRERVSGKRSEDAYNRATKIREELQLKQSVLEAESEPCMLQACEELESISLHRLDSERQVFTRACLVGRSSLSRHAMTLDALLFDCIEMNPVLELQQVARKVHARLK
mmetsp:Transcript_18375/g.34007  ORF Transcript_18375/g.34007 Transcript_18375/m.34007 type:complete len:579 (+) Transcript_18375:212-1948(+)